MEQASRGQLFNTSWTLHRLSPLHHAKDFETLLNNEAVAHAVRRYLTVVAVGEVSAPMFT